MLPQFRKTDAEECQDCQQPRRSASPPLLEDGLPPIIPVRKLWHDVSHRSGSRHSGQPHLEGRGPGRRRGAGGHPRNAHRRRREGAHHRRHHRRGMHHPRTCARFRGQGGACCSCRRGRRAHRVRWPSSRSLFEGESRRTEDPIAGISRPERLLEQGFLRPPRPAKACSRSSDVSRLRAPDPAPGSLT